MKKLILLLTLFLPFTGLADELSTEESYRNPSAAKPSHQEKLAEDPTKIVTKIGIVYTNHASFKASLGIGPVSKINAMISEDADEWRIGGSYLFNFGIVNVNFGKTEFEHDASQSNYSIGTFIPLNVFGFAPLGIQIFPTMGYTYNEGEIAVDNKFTDISNDFVMIPLSNHGGYLGAFALKPLNKHWNLMGFGGGSIGSDDYSGYWLGGGAGYTINKRNSFNIFGFIRDNNFGAEQKIGASYTYQFN